MRKIVALALPLLFLSLMTIQGNAVITPVEVERVKDVCFVRIRADHHTVKFLFHYESLFPTDDAIPGPQTVKVNCHFYGPQVDYCWGYSYTVYPGDSVDDAYGRTDAIGDFPYGTCMDFTIRVFIGRNLVTTITDSVIIPPP